MQHLFFIGSATWNNTIASVLSTHSNIFLSGFEKFKQSGKKKTKIYRIHGIHLLN